MKGDMYDDGTPNPLVVKCPICGCTDIGTRIGTGQVACHCRSCHHVWFARGDEAGITGPIQHSQPGVTAPSYSVTTPYNSGTECVMDNYNAWLTGWMCPKCGRVYSPTTTECEHCNNPINTTASGRINQSSSAETHMEGVTATMGTQEKRVRQDGSFVIDKSLFPGLNLSKDSTVYAGSGGTRWNKAKDTKAQS